MNTNAPKEIVSAAVSLLKPFFPTLTAASLLAAVGESENAAVPTIEKPLTRRETARLLSVSTMTVYRFVRSGKLKAIQIGDHSVRIDPSSVRKLLGQENSKSEA